jgi:3-hydroxy-9,10-secoandrosta-1,3,5(10)-triene-9,17-dione monooxygenase reductase component
MSSSTKPKIPASLLAPFSSPTPSRVAGPLDPAEFRRALGQFPTGVTIVTAAGPTRPLGMTANSFSSVSLDPPLVSWCCACSSPSHDGFAAAEGFAVHFLGADHRDLALRFAGKGGGDRFDGVAHRPGRYGAPLIEELAPVFECRTWARYPGGDHTILIGEVVELVERVQEPLLFHSGILGRIERARPLPQLAHDSFAKNYLSYLLARASDIVSAEFHAAIATWRLSVAEWRVLACLSDAEGIGIVDLAGMALMKQPRITKIVDRLEADGLVERRTHEADRRRALVHLTALGRTASRPSWRPRSPMSGACWNA